MDSLERPETSTRASGYPLVFAGAIAVAVCGGLTGAFLVATPHLSAIFALATLTLLGGTLWLMRKLMRTGRPPIGTADPAIDPSDWKLIAEHRLQGVVDSISDGFVLWDKDNRLLFHNRQATRHDWPTPSKGMHFDQYVTDTFPLLDERTTGGDPQRWLEQRRLWLSEAHHSHEVRAKDGTWSLLTERRTPDGGTVTTYTDITEAKISQRVRALSERRLAHAQALARIGIFEWDARGSDMFWSDIMYEIVGLPTDSPPLDFSQYLLLVHPESRDLVRSTFRRLLTSGGKYNQEYEIIRPDGQIRAVRAEAEAVLHADGSVIRVLGSVHDQTSAKRVETALREAKEAAVTANNAKSEFLANISHELRTPLNAVIGFSEVMIQEVFGPVGNDRYREYAGDIRQSGVHLLGVINDLLDYSKLEAGRVELHVEDISPAAIMDKCIRMMRQRAEAEDLTLLTDTGDAEDTVIRGDDRKITQVILNLMSNAIKFTPAGGLIRLSISRSGDGVDIVVSDSGIGMSANDIELALAPFGQVDSSLNREYTGTGLGLPLSKSLVELHGGTMTIDSMPGKGTTCTVHLSYHMTEGTQRPPLRLVSGGQAG
ncbi:MAG: PAS domain S-box-containing protein [Paracoccaceae bacterium]|jgi:PAS domain S-box-containing protein